MQDLGQTAPYTAPSAQKRELQKQIANTYSCKNSPLLPSNIVRMETGKIGLGKLDCSPLLEPHLEGISLFAVDSGHTTAGVTLYTFSLLHINLTFLLIRAWPLICQRISLFLPVGAASSSFVAQYGVGYKDVYKPCVRALLSDRWSWMYSRFGGQIGVTCAHYHHQNRVHSTRYGDRIGV
jgi:hypothetical protein